MNAKLKELKEILDIAKEYGLSYVKVGTIEAHLGNQPSKGSVKTPTKKELKDFLKQSIGSEQGVPTDDELLFWSSGGPIPNIKTEEPRLQGTSDKDKD